MTTFGNAISPEIACGLSCTLSFDWLDDSESGDVYDVFRVFVESGTSSYAVLVNVDPFVTSYRSFSLNLTDELGFGLGDLFSVRFFFDTVDGVANNTAGVRVDNFLVSDSTGVGGAVPLPAAGFLMLGGLACLAGASARRGRRQNT